MRLEIPNPNNYEEEGSETGEVASAMTAIGEGYKDIFPQHYDLIEPWVRAWQWGSIDPAYRLQWVAESLLAENNFADYVGSFEQAGETVEMTISFLGPKAKDSGIESDGFYWDTLVSGVRIEFKTDKIVWFETRSNPASWVSGESDSDQTGELYYGEWEDHLEGLADLIIANCFEPIDDPDFPELPVGTILNESQAIDFWVFLWNERSFSGIGSAGDVVKTGHILKQIADSLVAKSAGYKWMQLLAEGSRQRVYDNGYRPNGSWVNGNYRVIENVQGLKLETPDGILEYDAEDWASENGTLYLDEQEFDRHDPKVEKWLEEIQQGTWAWSGAETK